MIRTYTFGCCCNCGRDGDIDENKELCRECLGIEPPSPPPGPPEKVFQGPHQWQRESRKRS